MKQKKNRLLIILIIIVSILLILLGFTYAYIATDFLKGNKQLFFNYIQQFTDDKEGFIDNDLKQYFAKQNSTPYTNKGTFTAKISGPEEIENQIKNVNNMNISFSGQVDNTASKLLQDVSINYSKNVSFPFSFKKVQDTIGIQTQYISKQKYISTDINKIEDLKSDLTTNTMSESAKTIKQAEDIFSINIKEQLKNVENRYLNILEQNFQDSQFSKIEEGGEKGYRLTLSNKELTDIEIKLLEELKNDQVTLDKINEYIETLGNFEKITANKIDKAINELNNQNNDDNKFELTIYQKNRKISKIQLNIEGININIQKSKSESDLQYNISFESKNEKQESFNIYLNLKYDGLLSLQNINEEYELGISSIANSDTTQTLSYTYRVLNNVNFEESSNIENFTDNNSVNLNNLQKEQRNNFLNNVEQRINETNKAQMESLGITENENPLIYINPITYLSMSVFNITDNTIVSDMEEAEITTFNSKFELYQGTNQGGATVKGLLTTIAQNNGLDEDEDQEENNQNDVSNNSRQIKEINFNGEEFDVNKQTIAMLKEEISIEDHFRIEFERDENSGRIYRVVISKK